MNININYLLTLTESLQSFLLYRHFIWKYFVVLMNVKEKTEISHLSNANITKQPLWNNEIFEYHEQSISFKNWIDGNILYLKDLFNND